jgi:methyl-accepting chemotaxis protein
MTDRPIPFRCLGSRVHRPTVSPPIDEPSPARRFPVIFGAGVFMLVASLVGVALGLMVIDSLTRDFGASLEVSRSAVASVGDTVQVVAQVTEGTSATIESAAASASSASETAQTASAALANVADFLNEDLPENIETIRSALPGAIAAADAVDTTLGALALIGVDYSPEEPFGDSLRGIQSAVASLPAEIRIQSESLRTLVPSAETLASDVDGLARSLEEMNEGLQDVDELTRSYSETVTQAEEAIDQTESSLDRTVLLLRLLLILVAVSAAVIGFALISIDRALGRAIVRETVARESVPSHR